MSLKDVILEEIAELAPAALEALIALVRGAKSSGDATRYLQRKATSDVAHLASQEAARELLEKTRK